MRLVRCLVVALVVGVVSLGAFAQPLADRIPSDALLYVGWAGADRLGPAYVQSHLKGVLDASNAPELFSQLGPRIVRRLQLEQMLQGDPVAKEVLPALISIGEQAWHNPTALYFGPLDYSGKMPIPKLALFCQAGKDAQALSEQATKVAAQLPPDAPFKIKVQVWPGDVVVVSNFEIGAKVDESLAQREQFANAMKQGRPDPAVTVFFDAEKVLNVASLAINMAADAKSKQIWQRTLLATGMAGIKRLVYTAGFDGKDWGSQAFVDAPQPRMGLLATLLESEPVSDDLLARAPQSSNWVSAARIDLAKMLGLLRTTAARIDPQAGQHVEQVLTMAGQAIGGYDLQKDLFASLGDQWLAFNSDATGHGVLGMTLVNPLRNAAALDKALNSMAAQANTAMAHQAENGNAPTLSIETTKVGDLEIHYFAIPALAPCWAIKDDTLYVALFPQILAAAVEEKPAPGRSFLDNADFAAARKRLGVEKNAGSISYMDLPKLAPRGYQMVLALQRGGLGVADMFGLQTPAMVLPPLNKIRPHLATSISATWSDDLGWHYRGVTPFPGADALGGEQALVAAAAPVAAAVVLPATARARQQAMNVQSMSNLRQIGQGVMMYANDNKGDVAPDLGATARYLQTPLAYVTADHVGAVPATLPPDELAKWVNANSDYAYVGNGLGKINVAGPDKILAHEKFELSKNGMTSVLFADGHVEMQPTTLARDRVRQQQERMMKAKQGAAQ